MSKRRRKKRTGEGAGAGKDATGERGAREAAYEPRAGETRGGETHIFRTQMIAAGSGHGQVKRFTNINEHPLTLAFEREKIDAAEYEAGNVYRHLCERTQRSGRDSSDMIAMSGVASSGGALNWSEGQAQAVKTLARIDQHLSARDRKILRRFCGEAFTPAQAVLPVVPCHPNTVLYRLREALDALADALDAAGVRRAA